MEIKENVYLGFWILVFLFLSMLIGYLTSNYYDIDFVDNIFGKRVEKNKVDGLWFYNYNITKSVDAEMYASEYSGEPGRWVCVNIKNMDFERAFEVCRHEVGHEIWASYCQDEDNFEKCVNVTK